MDNKIPPPIFCLGSDVLPGLSKLNEECGEVVQVIGKLMQTGGNPEHWSGNLRTMLIEEMGDVAAAINFFVEHNFTPEEIDALCKRSETKGEKFSTWHKENSP
jgi:NTP pyrophosphatase (non-canonical NTP hydrolase)